MRRDMELLRLLLQKLEMLSEEHDDPTSIYMHGWSELELPTYSAEQLAYHYALAVEAGLVDHGKGNSDMDGFIYRRLTWQGHDFVDSTRDDEIWAKTTNGAKAAGGFSIELLRDLATGFIRKKVAEHTGIEL